MKIPLLDKLAELRGLAQKKPDVLPESGLSNIEAFEENVRLLPDGELSNSHNDEYATLLDQATRLELEFEDTHPHFSSTMREIVRILTDMGI